MEMVGFWDPVKSSSCSVLNGPFDLAEELFAFGSREIIIYPGEPKIGSRENSAFGIAFKILLFCTVIIPLIAIVIKTIHRAWMAELSFQEKPLPNNRLQQVLNKPRIRDEELFLAIYDNETRVPVLLEGGANPNVRDSSGYTPLHLCKNPEIARLLIEYGANVNAITNDGATPLFYASNEEIQKVLIKAGASTTLIVQKELSYPSPIPSLFTKIVVKGPVDLFYTSSLFSILEQSPKLEKIEAEPPESLDTLFHQLLRCYHSLSAETVLRVGQILLNSNANINSRNEENQSPLYQAIKNHQFKLAEWLLDRGANLHENLYRIEDDPLAAFQAVKSKNLKIAKAVLYPEGVDLMKYHTYLISETSNSHDESLLVLAARTENTEIVSLVLEMDKNIPVKSDFLAFVNKQTSQQLSPLIISALLRKTEMAITLTDAGARLNPTSDMTHSLFRQLCTNKKPNLKMIILLFSKGLDGAEVTTVLNYQLNGKTLLEVTTDPETYNFLISLRK